MGAAVALLYAVLPHAFRIGDLAYDVFGIACVVAMVVGIRRNGSARLTPWILCAVGLGLFVAGDAVWNVYGDILHRDAPVASLADALYLPGYVALAVGCLGFARSRGGRDPDALLDATVVALGGGVLVLSLVIMPSAGSLTPVIDRVVVSLYPVMDLAILTVLIRLALVPGRRSPVLWLVLGSFSFMLVGDLVYAILQQSSSYTAGLLDATWLLAYVGLGAAALHPDMGTLTGRNPHREESTLGWGRTAMLGLALLVAPAVLIARGLVEQNRDDILDGALTAVVSILVLWRIVRATRQRQRVEATLTHTALHDARHRIAEPASPSRPPPASDRSTRAGEHGRRRALPRSGSVQGGERRRSVMPPVTSSSRPSASG